MALTVPHASAQLFSDTKVLPLAANDGDDRTAYVFITAKGSAQSANVLGTMTGWTEVLNLGTGNPSNGNDPRQWVYKKAVPTGTADFTIPHSDSDGSWVLYIVEGELGTDAVAYKFGYDTSMSILTPATNGVAGILMGCLGTNALVTVTEPYTAVGTANGYSNGEGAYSIDTFGEGNTDAFTTSGITNYTLSWVYVDEAVTLDPIVPVEGVTVITNSASGNGMLVTSGEGTLTTSWTFSRSPHQLDVSCDLEPTAGLASTEGFEVFVSVLDSSDDSVVVPEEKIGDVIGGESTVTSTKIIDVSGDTALGYDVVYRVARDTAANIRPVAQPPTGGPIEKGNIPIPDYWELLGMDARVGATEYFVDDVSGSDAAAGTTGDPWKSISYGLSQLNGSTGTLWVRGDHPPPGDLTSIKGQDEDNIIAIRGESGARIVSTATGEAMGFHDISGYLCVWGLDFVHTTYQANALNWADGWGSGNRSTFGLLIQGDQYNGGGATDYAPNMGKFWVLNNSFEGFGHGCGGLGVPSHIIAGNYAIDCAYWGTGGGSGISATRLGGAQYNGYGSWDPGMGVYTNDLGWDLSPIYTSPDGVDYQYVEMGNVAIGNRQKISSYDISVDYQSDGNGIIYGDSTYSVGRALQTLNISIGNGGQGINAYEPPQGGIDQYFNTTWDNGYHVDDGIYNNTGTNTAAINKAKLNWLHEIIAHEYQSGAVGDVAAVRQVGNLCGALSRVSTGLRIWTANSNFTSTTIDDNVTTGKTNDLNGTGATAGVTLESSLGVLYRSTDLSTADPRLTVNSPARGAAAASHRKADWDFQGITVATTGSIDAGACQYGGPVDFVQHLDASTITGLNNGDAITTWTASVGNDAVKYTGTKTYRTADMGGKPSVRWVGSDSTFAEPFGTSTVAEYTIIVSAMWAGVGSGAEVIIGNQASPNGADGVRLFIDDNNSGSYAVYSDSGTMYASQSTGANSTDTPYVFTVRSRIDGSNQVIGLWRDGVLQEEYTASGLYPLANGADWTLAAEKAAGGIYYFRDGQIGELKMWDRALSDVEREATENAMMSKYGIL